MSNQSTVTSTKPFVKMLELLIRGIKHENILPFYTDNFGQRLYVPVASEQSSWVLIWLGTCFDGHVQAALKLLAKEQNENGSVVVVFDSKKIVIDIVYNDNASETITYTA